MTEEERNGVRHLINQTIERLQRASVGANHMGSRYARLLQLLWRKAPKRNTNPNPNPNQQSSSIESRLNPNTSAPNPTANPTDPSQFNQVSYPTQGQFGGGMSGMGAQPGFSWLDLGATWNFATQNGNSSSGSAGEGRDGDEGSLGLGSEMSPFDMNLLTDYSLLEGDNPNLIF